MIQPNVKISIDKYVKQGVPLGDFLRAVASNDLKEACARADDENKHWIVAIVSYFYNECPAYCWGSPKAYKNWLKRKRDERDKEIGIR